MLENNSGQASRQTAHYEISKYCLSTGKVHAQVVQNLTVRQLAIRAPYDAEAQALDAHAKSLSALSLHIPSQHAEDNGFIVQDKSQL